MRSLHAYASEPSANSNARSNTALSRVGSGSHPGFTMNTTSNTAKVTAQTRRRASTPQAPNIATPTYSRSSTGMVHSEPLTAFGKGLDLNAPGRKYSTRQPSALCRANVTVIGSVRNAPQGTALDTPASRMDTATAAISAG